MKDFDLIIIGGGAAGLTAAIYAVRYNLKTAVVSFDFGGQVLETGEIENWPGSPTITGPQLSKNMEEHARGLGAAMIAAYVKKVEKLPDGFRLYIDGYEKEYLDCRALIYCAGAKHKKLGVTGETEFAGRGVSYCVTCDSAFFKGKVVAVVGGGDAAVTGAIDISGCASKVYLIHRRDEFKAKPGYVDMAKSKPNIEILLNTTIVEIKGGTKVEKILLDTSHNGSNELAVDGVFVEIGFMPESSLVKELGIEGDAKGYIPVDNKQATSVPGVFAAGDVTNSSNRFAQLVTAAAEGSIAANSAFKYLTGLDK